MLELYETDLENYYELIRIKNVTHNNYFKYKSNCNRHKNLSLAEYQQEIRPHLKDSINNFKKIGNRWKIQLPIKMFKKNMKCI